LAVHHSDSSAAAAARAPPAHHPVMAAVLKHVHSGCCLVYMRVLKDCFYVLLCS
jgi:hypothetical protein